MEQINIVVAEEEKGQRLDLFVLAKVPSLSRSRIKNMIESGLVLIDGKQKKSGEKLKVGNNIEVCIEENKQLCLEKQNIDIDIVYEDDDLAVINKQQNMVVHPAAGNEDGTLVNALLFHLDNLSGINGVERPGIVHRIDKDTSGLLVVAKNDKSHASLAKQIEEKTCKRDYVAICLGKFKNQSGVVDVFMNRSLKDRKKMAVCKEGEGKRAITHYEVLQEFKKYSLVKFSLKTGRTHQIRVACKQLSHPILGDEVYGVLDKNIKTTGQLLHAFKLCFVHPTTQKEMVFETKMPSRFEDVFAKL